MKVDRKSECKYCRLCHKNFNHGENKPHCLIPCGHTFCRECTLREESFKQQRHCPMCKENFSQIIPDYEMIDMLNSLVKLAVAISDEEDEIDGKHVVRDRESGESLREKPPRSFNVTDNKNVKQFYFVIILLVL
jgi:hypothetical protein